MEYASNYIWITSIGTNCHMIILIFDRAVAPKPYKSCPIFYCSFGAFLDIGLKNKWHHSIPGRNLILIPVSFIKKRKFNNFTFLTWSWHHLEVKWENNLPSYSMSKIAHATFVTLLIYHIPIWWPFVTWHWSQPILSMMLSHIQCIHLLFRSSLGPNLIIV